VEGFLTCLLLKRRQQHHDDSSQVSFRNRVERRQLSGFEPLAKQVHGCSLVKTAFPEQLGSEDRIAPVMVTVGESTNTTPISLDTEIYDVSLRQCVCRRPGWWRAYNQ
jgi:hypothetical protein